MGPVPRGVVGGWGRGLGARSAKVSSDLKKASSGLKIGESSAFTVDLNVQFCSLVVF